MQFNEAKKNYESPVVRKLDVKQLRAFVFRNAKEFLQLVFPAKRNGDSSAETAPESRKQYQPPGLRKLTPEQAKLLLIGHVSMRNEGAKEILELFFSEPDDSTKERT